MDLHLNEAEAVKVMHCVVLERVMGAGSEELNLPSGCICVKMWKLVKVTLEFMEYYGLL